MHRAMSERAGELWEEGLRLLRPKEDPLQYAMHLCVPERQWRWIRATMVGLAYR